MKTDISTQKKYIEQTYKLDQERKELVMKMTDELLTKNEFVNVRKRLTDIYHTLSSNAVILADILAYHINKDGD